MQTLNGYRAIILHENTASRRSEIFETEQEARQWARENLSTTPRASKRTKDAAKMTGQKPRESFEVADIKARPEGKKSFTVRISRETVS